MWWAVPAWAATVDADLNRQPVLVVDLAADGHVREVAVVLRVAAPPEVVWARLVAFGRYAEWVPLVEKSELLPSTDGRTVVSWVISAPGPNVHFVGAYTVDASQWLITGVQTSGQLTGSTWSWSLQAEAGGTRVTRKTYVSAVTDNWLLRALDDESHTLEIALNTASPVVELVALKRAVERDQ